ncbi:hypothetical protein SAMN05444279_1145 [Ruegeria intermedia]|uniref:Uncharacterized protein n=1 Tax=Ruegeria intermedia TaxID=996115 RepID=A0A1M4Y556_9RHOB|nr:hypothetical protein [Ruegeria intermedia]SHF00835.1 hypothetical protein SAMN05444279_1145 [Ruegeria intermedia]
MMAEDWFRRRAHRRRLPGGRETHVRETWVPRHPEADRKKSFRSRCPRCGAAIVSVPMPNGGRVHFEGGKGLGRIKHPCLHVGEGLSRRRADDTDDLFAWAQSQGNSG